MLKTKSMEFPMRINKYLAHKGIATRKGADVLVETGKVYVNGKKAIIGMQITATDVVEVKNAIAQTFDYILYYKPRGVITHSPAEGETDILGRIKKDHKITNVFPVGRLDKDSEGLILLTNDGRVTERLLSPDAAHEKEYAVTVDKRVTGTFINALSHGVRIERYVTKPAKAVADKGNERGFTITLTEGKKHQVRRMCAALGYQVQSLKRIRIMQFSLRKLAPGQFHRLSQAEIKAFHRALGLQ